MSPEDRDKLGIISPEVAAKSWAAGEEKKLQDLIRNWLSLQKLPFYGSRMDKRTTRKKGEPDFVVCCAGHFVAIECKTGHEQPTDEQQAQLNLITLNGGATCVARSLDDVRAVVKLMQKYPVQ
jgi:hypothetical protein